MDEIAKRDGINEEQFALLVLEEMENDDTGVLSTFAAEKIQKKKSHIFARRIAKFVRRCRKQAEEILQNGEKMEALLIRAEEKVRKVPGVGRKLAYVPEMILLLRSYRNREYTAIPLPKLLAILTAILYFVLPVDALPDHIPGLGFLDDALVTGIVIKLCNDDLDRFMDWLKRERKAEGEECREGHGGNETDGGKEKEIKRFGEEPVGERYSAGQISIE